MLDANAEKIDSIRSKQHLKIAEAPIEKGAPKRSHKTMRLSSINLPSAAQATPKKGEGQQGVILSKPSPLKFRLNKMKKLSTDLLAKAKPITLNLKSFYQSATDANTTAQGQDLHLFNLEKIYYQKKLQSKLVASWKLPKSVIIKKRLDEYLSRIQHDKNKEGSKHQVTKILVGKQGEDAQKEFERTNEQLALQKEQQDTRNFNRTGSLFN